MGFFSMVAILSIPFTASAWYAFLTQFASFQIGPISHNIYSFYQCYIVPVLSFLPELLFIDVPDWYRHFLFPSAIAATAFIKVQSKEKLTISNAIWAVLLWSALTYLFFSALAIFSMARSLSSLSPRGAIEKKVLSEYSPDPLSLPSTSQETLASHWGQDSLRSFESELMTSRLFFLNILLGLAAVFVAFVEGWYSRNPFV